MYKSSQYMLPSAQNAKATKIPYFYSDFTLLPDISSWFSEAGFLDFVCLDGIDIAFFETFFLVITLSVVFPHDRLSLITILRHQLLLADTSIRGIYVCNYYYSRIYGDSFDITPCCYSVPRLLYIYYFSPHHNFSSRWILHYALI